MAEPKTKPTDTDVSAFIQAIEEEQKRKDCEAVMKIMKQASKEKPVLWGGSIIGFGSYHYVYASGNTGDWPLTGFSPRKKNITLYIMPGFDKYEALMKKLGKFKTGKSCLYINKLSDVDTKVLTELVRLSVEYMRKKYPAQ
jgi:Domain of unknown function (DU1801)